MRCKDVGRKISAYIDDEITNGTEHEVSQHLALCRRCQRLRESLVLSRFYLRKLRQDPAAEFYPDMSRVFAADKPVFSGIAFRKPALLFLAAVGIMLAALWLFKPFAFLTGAGKYAAEEGLSLLPQSKQIDIDFGRPTLIRVSKNSWLNIEGRGSLIRLKDLIKIDLTEGQIFVYFDRLSGLAAMINANGFTVVSSRTEFSVSAAAERLQIQLLQGQLSVRYGTKRDLKAQRISSGQGATGITRADGQSLTVYKLSEAEIVNLARKIDQLEKISRYVRSNPKQTNFQSGDIRMEFWKGQ